jgi:hypothetical protein
MKRDNEGCLEFVIEDDEPIARGRHKHKHKHDKIDNIISHFLDTGTGTAAGTWYWFWYWYWS